MAVTLVVTEDTGITADTEAVMVITAAAITEITTIMGVLEVEALGSMDSQADGPGDSAPKRDISEAATSGVADTLGVADMRAGEVMEADIGDPARRRSWPGAAEPIMNSTKRSAAHRGSN